MVKFDIRSKYKAFTGKHLRFMYSVVKMEQLANFCVEKKVIKTYIHVKYTMRLCKCLSLIMSMFL